MPSLTCRKIPITLIDSCPKPHHLKSIRNKAGTSVTEVTVSVFVPARPGAVFRIRQTLPRSQLL